jgi:hypothetical protein
MNFNVEAQCTPSRSALMTGRFAIRSGTHSVPIGGGLEGLTQWEVTIAELLSGAGYATGHFGKWHLGSEQGRLPNDQGFDERYGIPRTTDEVFAPSDVAAKAAGVVFEHVMEGKKGEKSRELQVYDLEQRRLIDAEITRRTIDFIKRNGANRSMLMSHSRSSISQHYRTRNSRAQQDSATFRMHLRKWTRTSVISWTRSINCAFVRTPSSCLRATMVQKQPGPGRDHPVHGAVTTLRTWKAPSEYRS